MAGLPPPLRRAQTTRLVGREEQLAVLDEALAGRERLLSVVGPPGAGKTRLVAELLVRRQARGTLELGKTAWFVDLSPCTTAEMLCMATARALDPTGLGQSAGEPAEAIGRALGLAGRVLLVLDNLEQLLPGAAPLLARWLEGAPEAKLLVTSRMAAEVTGEWVLSLPNLSVSAESEAAAAPAASEAAELFRLRAEAAGCPLDALETAPLVGEIVRQLDGNPLAIELAAARLELLSLESLRDGLSDRFRLLRDPTGVAAERHQSLQRALDWSWQLLSAPEQETLQQVSVFAGGFDLEAAAAVVHLPAAADGEPPLVLDALHALCRRHLLRAQREGSAAGPVRLSCDESIRALGAARLEQSGSSEAVRARHAQHYVATVQELAVRAEADEDPSAAAAIDAESYNLIAAARWGVGATPSQAALQAALSAAAILAPVLVVRSPAAFLSALAEPALALAAAHPDWARGWAADALASWTGSLLYRQGDHALARRRFEMALEGARARDDALRAAVALRGLANLAWVAEEAEGRALCEAALAQYERAGSPVGMARCLSMLGAMETQQGRLPEGESDLRRGLALVADGPAWRARADVAHYLAQNLINQRRNDEALSLLAASLEARRAVGHQSGEALELYLRAVAEHDRGALVAARAAYDRSVALLARLGEWFLSAWVRRLRALLDLEEGRLEAAAREFSERLPGDAALNSKYFGLFGAGLACAHLLLGDEAAGREALARVEPLFDALPPCDHRIIPEAVRGLLDLTGPDGEVDPARIATARARLAQLNAAAAPEPRLMGRLLAARLARVDAERSSLWAASDGSWFRPPGGATVSLARKRTLARLLAALLEQRWRVPGQSLPREDLIAAGWPDQHVRDDSAANRLYVALNSLRGLGLETVLQRTGEGYRLNPDVPLRWQAHGEV